MAADLVELEELKAELRLPSVTGEDEVLGRKVAEATDLCLDYVKQRLGDTAAAWSETVEGWTSETVPTQVKAAILELAVALWRFRGDDDAAPEWYAKGELPGGVKMKLGRFRDPAVA